MTPPKRDPTPSMVTFPWPEAHVWRRWMFYTGLVVLVAYLAYVVREIWLPLGLAFLLATVLDPVVDRMEARGWKRGPATAFIFGSFILILVGLIVLATPYVMAQGDELQKGFLEKFPDTSRAGLIHSMREMHAPDWAGSVAFQAYEGSQQAFQRSSTWFTQYGMSFLSNLIWVVIVPIVAFYALRDYHLILGKALLLVPRKRRDDAQTYVVEVGTIFAKYLRGLAIVSALNGLATWLLLMAMGVPSSLVLGIVAGILYSVPYIGAMITILLTALVSFFAPHGGLFFPHGGVPFMLFVVGCSFVLHQIVFDQIISPKILGGHVGIHPILAIVALLSGNLLLGIVGMILAVPVAACIQIGVLAAVPKLRLDIEVAPPTTDASSPPGADASQIASGGSPAHDATEELHQNVKTAVDQVEAQAKQDLQVGVAHIHAPVQTSDGE